VPFVYGELCPEISPEPVTCGANEMFCPGHTNADGCLMPDFCEPSTDSCPTLCPVECPKGEIKCANEYDAAGCPKEPLCSVGGCCEPKLVECGANEEFCGGFDSKGCKTPGQCLSNDPCLANCPIDCGPTESVCDGGVDATGCPLPQVCSDVCA